MEINTARAHLASIEEIAKMCQKHKDDPAAVARFMVDIHYEVAVIRVALKEE